MLSRRHKSLILSALATPLFCVLLIPRVPPAWAEVPPSASSPVGVWATPGPDGAWIRIDDCGGKLCGTIVKLDEPINEEGKEKRDENNPDPALRNRPVVGIVLFSGLSRDAPDGQSWSGGGIYDPKAGKIYSCKMTLDDPDTLAVRGYIGITLLGKTSVWKRVSQF